MSRKDPPSVDRMLDVAQRTFAVLIRTAAICVALALSVLVLAGTLIAATAATGSQRTGSIVALLVFGLFVSLPVYWLAVSGERRIVE